MSVCDHKGVIFQTKRARCALNMEILDLFNEESVSGVRSHRASLNSMRKSTEEFGKVSQLLKCYSKLFWGHIATYLHIHIQG